jgi:hypothetical protein
MRASCHQLIELRVSRGAVLLVVLGRMGNQIIVVNDNFSLTIRSDLSFCARCQFKIRTGYMFPWSESGLHYLTGASVIQNRWLGTSHGLLLAKHPCVTVSSTSKV